MVQRKSKAHLSLVNGRRLESKKSDVDGGGGIRIKGIESGDHWDFLEEIEAPMWVDLTLETKYMNQDIDDEWFQMVHPFHQCSSRQLISAFSLFGEGNTSSNSDLVGPFSPKLPPSVSRSRGKHYRSRKWEGDNISMNKQHPVKILAGKISGSAQERKPKSSFGNQKGISTSKESLFCQKSKTSTSRLNSPKNMSTLGDTKNRWSSKAGVVGVSNSTSTIVPSSSKQKFSFGELKSSSNSKASTVTESNQQQPLKASEESASTIIPSSSKQKFSFGESKSSSNSKASTVTESNQQQSLKASEESASTIVTSSPKQKFSFGESKSSSNSKASFVTESNQQQPLKASEESHQIFGQTTGIFFGQRISLRKSCVTRQPSRVEIKQSKGCKSSSGKSSVGSSLNLGRQSKDRKSSSSKSSVGSSLNFRCDLKNTTLTAMLNDDRTPESRNIVSLVETAKHQKRKALNVSKTSTVCARDQTCYFEWGAKAVTGKSAYQEASKSKVLHNVPTKALELRKINVQDPLNVCMKAERVDSRRSKRVAGSGKVNAIGRMISGQTASGKENAVGGMVLGRKASKHREQVKNDTGLADLKVKTNGRNQRENPVNVVQRVYFR